MLSEKHFGSIQDSPDARIIVTIPLSPRRPSVTWPVQEEAGEHYRLWSLSAIGQTVLSLEKKKTLAVVHTRILSVTEFLLCCARGRRKAVAAFQSPSASLPSSSLGCQKLHLPRKQTVSLGVKFAVCPLRWFLHVGCYYVQSIKLSASRLFTELLSSQSRWYMDIFCTPLP